MRVLFVVYDNESHVAYFPMGIAYLTSVLEEHGHQVEIYCQDIYHTPDSHLTDHLDSNRYDMVGLSFIGGYFPYRKALKISEAINRSKQRPFYCLGGHGPSPEPEYFLRVTGADAICIGEGERTIVDLVDAISGNKSLGDVGGIAWRDGNEVFVNPRRPLIQDLDSIPFPAYHRFPMHVYRLIRFPHCAPTDFVGIMISGRGCDHRCTFCYRLDAGFRPRSNEGIIEEMKMLKRDFGITYIYFSDEILLSSAERAISFSEALLRNNIQMKWMCCGRLNHATPEVMQIMKRAGCVFVHFGIECFDDEILRNMRKGLTTDIIVKGVEASLAAGVTPGINVMFGIPGENRDTLRKTTEFVLKYDKGAQVRNIKPVTPFPGTELYAEAIRRGLLKDCADFYEKKHVNSDLLTVNFTDLSDEEYYSALYEANLRILKGNLEKNTEYLVSQLEQLYVGKDATFRGFRQT